MAYENYIANGTALSINGEAGADYAFSMEGVANNAGRVSAQIDLGAAPRPYIFHWSAECQMQATPTLLGTIDFYIATAPDSDSTQIDGDVGSSDAALGSAAQINNLQYIGSIVNDSTTASQPQVAHGDFICYSRYLSIVGFNGVGSTINATDSNFQFILTPKSFQLQVPT